MRTTRQYIESWVPEKENPRYMFAVACEVAGVHFWVEETGLESGQFRYIGGVENHYATPPDYMKNDPCSNEFCWLLGKPCWHDGSSLLAEDKYIPIWASRTEDGAKGIIFNMLENHLYGIIKELEGES